MINRRIPEFFFALTMILSTACSPEGTVVTTAITTTGATALPTSATTGEGETTGEPEPTTGGPDTSSTSSGAASTTTTTGADWPDGCLPDPDEYQCQRVPIDFCEYIAEACSDHAIAVAYCEIAVDKCLADEGPCSTCFWLANTCEQIGMDCDDLFNECACAAFGG